jgi:hypothetical protein
VIKNARNDKRRHRVIVIAVCSRIVATKGLSGLCLARWSVDGESGHEINSPENFKTNTVMGRQESLIQFRGAVGNISFYKSKVDGYLARKKGGVDGSRVLSDPAYERTRENMAEFARAGKASKLFRSAFGSLIASVADKRMTSRLTGAMVKVIREDALNSRGDRNVVDGDVSLLRGFEFNVYHSFRQAFDVQITSSIDRATGSLIIDIPAFKPNIAIKAPEGATHFKLKGGAAAIDFLNETYSVVEAEGDATPLDRTEKGPLQISPSLAPGSTHPLFLLLGIEFLQVIKSGEESPLKGGAFNAMAIVNVNRES